MLNHFLLYITPTVFCIDVNRLVPLPLKRKDVFTNRRSLKSQDSVTGLSTVYTRITLQTIFFFLLCLRNPARAELNEQSKNFVPQRFRIRVLKTWVIFTLLHFLGVFTRYLARPHPILFPSLPSNW